MSLADTGTLFSNPAVDARLSDLVGSVAYRGGIVAEKPSQY